MVDFGGNSSRVQTAGPNASTYETFLELFGAHLVFNAVLASRELAAPNADVEPHCIKCQMELGSLIRHIKEFLRKYEK